MVIIGILPLGFVFVFCGFSDQKGMKSEESSLPKEKISGTSDSKETEWPGKKLADSAVSEAPVSFEKASAAANSETSEWSEEPEKKLADAEKGRMQYASKVMSPFSKHEDRYQRLFASLEEGGMTPERISAIFSSKRAKEKDMTPVKRMSKRVISPASMRTKKQVRGIVRKIKTHLSRHQSYYDKLEERFGVNRELAAAILFKETYLGEFKNWKHESFTVLNSILSFMELPPNAESRQEIRMGRILSTAEKSLKGLLLYCDKYGIDITEKRFPSSFAGAVGIPQFMPMYMDYVITDRHAVPDLSRMSDAILSLGNLLKHRFNWPGYMALDKLVSIDKIVRKYVTYDKQKGVSFCMSADLDGYPLRRFVDEFGNIPHLDYIAKYAAVLMDYNYSSNYVLDVMRIAFHTHQG